MSRPRPVFAGDVIHIQRRTRDGRFFLIPHRATIALVQYAYAVSAARHGLSLHAFCMMSNHVHIIATDHEGRHPEFTAYAHRIIALGLKAMYNVDGAIWQEGGASVQRLIGAKAVVEAMAYLRVNPVAAGCVRHERDYPAVFGVSPANAPLEDFSVVVARPDCLGTASSMPEESEFTCTAPESLVHDLGREAGHNRLSEAVDRLRNDSRRARDLQGLGFLGIRRVLRASVWTRPSQIAQRNGYIATFKGVVADAIALAKNTLIWFRRAYANALAAFREGRRDVEFPPGTYLMCKRLGCVHDVV
jgi:putative transposase